MPLPRPLPRGILVPVVLALLGLALLCTTQPWQLRRRIDPAGLAWYSEVPGAALAPLATSLLPVAAAAVLAAQLMQRRARAATILLAGAAAATATVLLAMAAPSPVNGWWVVTLVCSLSASTGLVLLLDPRPRVARPAPAGSLPEHEQQRRAQAATWAALSGGEDPTARPAAPDPPPAGRMSGDSP